jgi:hypothetical protein
MVSLLRGSQGRGFITPRAARACPLTATLHHEKKTQRSMMIVAALAHGCAEHGGAAFVLAACLL